MANVGKHTSTKRKLQEKRRMRVRKKVMGSLERPRLCVTMGNRGIFLQLIDDDKGVTMVSLRTPKKQTANRVLCKKVGADLANLAKSKGITNVVFDRSGRLYHGRIAEVAVGAREGGLQF